MTRDKRFEGNYTLVDYVWIKYGQTMSNERSTQSIVYF
jgi:hypothetical protein